MKMKYRLDMRLNFFFIFRQTQQICDTIPVYASAFSCTVKKIVDAFLLFAILFIDNNFC